MPGFPLCLRLRLHSSKTPIGLHIEGLRGRGLHRSGLVGTPIIAHLLNSRSFLYSRSTHSATPHWPTSAYTPRHYLSTERLSRWVRSEPLSQGIALSASTLHLREEVGLLVGG